MRALKEDKHVDYEILNDSYPPGSIFALVSSNQSGSNGQLGKIKYMPTVTASQQQSQEHNLNFPSSRTDSYLCTPATAWAKGTHAGFLLCTSWDQSCDRSVYCKTVDCSLPKLNRFYKMEPKKSLWNGHSNCQKKRVWAVTLFISLCSRFSLCFSNQSSNLLNANCAQWRRDASQMPAYELWIELSGMRTSMSNWQEWVFYLRESNLTLPLSPKHISRAGFRAPNSRLPCTKDPLPSPHRGRG